MRTRHLIACAVTISAILSGCSTVASDPGQPPDAATLYQRHCAACHGETGEGTTAGSGLVDLPSRFNVTSLRSVISDGVGTMPGMPSLSSGDVDAIVTYSLDNFTAAESAG